MDEQEIKKLQECLEAKEWHLRDCLHENNLLWEFLKRKNLSEEFLGFLEKRRR